MRTYLFWLLSGGHSTMALHKLIEEEASNEFTVKHSIPMSGPYDVSGVQTEILIDGDDYPSPFYLPYVLFSYKSIYPELNEYSLEEMFISPFDSLLPIYFDGYHSSGQINGILPSNPIEILNPNFLNPFLSDSLHPFRIALAKNDLIDWLPQAPINFYYCNGDEHVTYLNSIVASEEMSNMEEAIIETTQIDPNYDHDECAQPSITQAILTFLTEAEACNSSISESNSIIDVITPNPSSNFITLTSTNYDVISIFSLNGRLLLKEKVEPGKNTIEVTSLSSGIYFVRTGSYTQKLIIK